MVRRCLPFLILSYGMHLSSPETHYNNAIMVPMTSQITSLTIVCSTVYSGADQRKHQSSASLALVRRIHQWPVRKILMMSSCVLWWPETVHGRCNYYIPTPAILLYGSEACESLQKMHQSGTNGQTSSLSFFVAKTSSNDLRFFDNKLTYKCGKKKSVYYIIDARLI